MQGVHYIPTGINNITYIYYPKTDKLYGTLEKPIKYKPPSYLMAKAIGGSFILLILLLSNYTSCLDLIFSLNVFQCMLISMIAAIIYRNTEMKEKIKSVLNTNILEISFEETTTGHYYTLKNTTAIYGCIYAFLYITSIVCWIDKLESFDFNSEEKAIFLFIVFLSFFLESILLADFDLVGRIKLMHRIRKEKRRLKKEKRTFRK